MVKITNGRDVLEVTSGAFKGIYQRQGYRKVVEELETDIPETKEKSDDELFLETIVEKPISQWNKTEIKKYAELNSIDLAGTKTVDDARELVKMFLESEAESEA